MIATIRAARRGAASVMFALLAVPAMGFVALAIDAGSAVWARSRLDAAADSAALTAVMAGSAALAADPNASLRPAQDAGAARFSAQAGALPGVSVSALDVAVAVQGARVSAVVTYGARYATRFARVVGVGTLRVGGGATIARNNSPYFDIAILTDNSSSMAIAATTQGAKQLGALVTKSPFYKTWGQSQACAFGCHFDSANNDFYGLAHSHNIALRIDVLRQAVQNVIATIAGSPQAPQFRVGVYTFAKTLATAYAMNGDLAGAEAAVQALTVPVTTDGGDADTNYQVALQSITTLLGVSGDGSTPSNRRKFLFIVTDGVADYAWGPFRVIQPFDPSLCAQLKANGVQVLTLYTAYFPIPTNGFYLNNVAPFVSSIAPDLQACASSTDYFFQATDAASITTALQAMLQAALATPARFTQ